MTMRELLDDRKVYPEHGDNLLLRVAMLWDDWLVQYRMNHGLPLTPQEAQEKRP